jgi:hypothetical protein
MVMVVDSLTMLIVNDKNDQMLISVVAVTALTGIK